MDKTGAFPQKGIAEHEGYVGGFTSVWITENSTVALPKEDGIPGQILNPYNLNQAYLKGCRNKGSHGLYGLEVGALRDYLKQHGSDLEKSIRNGTYRPNPVLRVEIAKQDPAASSAYLIYDFGENSIDEAIEYTKKAGLNYLYHLGQF